MPLQNSRISSVVSNIRSKIPKKSESGVVYSVILDETHPRISEDGGDVSLVGCIEFRLSTDIYSDTSNLNLALPIDKSIKDLPTRNEVVEIIHLIFFTMFAHGVYAMILKNIIKAKQLI